MYEYEHFSYLLEQKGLKTADVSRGTGIREGVFSDWKSGRYTPKIDKMARIAEFLEVPMESLAYGDEPFDYVPQDADSQEDGQKNNGNKLICDILSVLPYLDDDQLELLVGIAKLMDNQNGARGKIMTGEDSYIYYKKNMVDRLMSYFALLNVAMPERKKQIEEYIEFQTKKAKEEKTDTSDNN